MSDKLYIQEFLDVNEQFAIDKKRKIDLKEDLVAFVGSPKKHPSNENVVMLIENPFDEHKIFYEFYIDSISAVEEIGTIASENSQSAYQVRLWVKKGTIAIKSETFIV
ncbi:MAG TPA: inorganic pyrophosphatase Ppa [Spirochaetota bacterium]|jgi:inorganic pyrophosphatase|nr:inorganic pyrophosphatase Ppa [Spirochaetota bacterium]OQB00525.1 MAG: hypothetical protein BWY23_00089 [Spirochaetes bacterium ADurb.Bin218]HOK01111.1 inorganic pyrophosphatase Ppa [Spirochaetota bacterium]HOK91436.1 inorganic pyrophosphatase Ppa [Spirochaetota bacterium]HON16538.1 inorganic pyrophosphatase Ppa [Spirochaetota bacterium]